MATKVDRRRWVSPSEFGKMAELGRSYAKLMLSSGPANQGFHPISYIRTGWSRGPSLTNYEAQDVLSNESGISEVTTVYNEAIQIKTGNCTEHASVAFIYLHRLGVKPIYMLGYDNGMLRDNHMFVAVGLDLELPNFTTDIRHDPRQWGKVRAADKSYICDPWRNVAYRSVDKFWETETNITGSIEFRAYSL